MSRYSTRSHWSMLLAVLVIPLLACGPLSGKVKQAKEVAETAQQVATGVAATVEAKADTAAPVGTEVPSAGQATEPVKEVDAGQLTHLLANVVKLAPVHATSLWARYKGQELQEKARVEMDIDEAGNRHVFVSSGDEDTLRTELVQVDGDMFVRSGPDEEFLVLSGQAGAGDLDFMAFYGAPWLLFFNDVEQASPVGSETVNGFETDKYDIKFNTLSLGPLGAAALIRGGLVDYKGTGWIEPHSLALVKSSVDITVKDSGDAQPTILQVRYDVTKADVAPIQRPSNVFAPPTPGS